MISRQILILSVLLGAVPTAVAEPYEAGSDIDAFAKGMSTHEYKKTQKWGQRARIHILILA